MKRVVLISALALSTSGCAWMGRQADALGEHMPVIGERCEHWQCITQSGQATSNAYKVPRDKENPPHDATAAPVEDVQSTPTPAPYPNQ